MADRPTLVLNSGGLKSLVATATASTAADHREAAPLVVLHADDGREASRLFHACFLRQAEHFKAERHVELSMPHLYRGRGPAERLAPAGSIQLLTAALGEAIRCEAARLVWPVNAGGDVDRLAAVTETIVLMEHVGRLAGASEVQIETPLLELTTRQIVELGEQMRAPWRLSRSCRRTAREPCGACETCLARAEAFKAAHLHDPILPEPERAAR